MAILVDCRMQLSREITGRMSHIMYKVAIKLYCLTTLLRPRARVSPLSSASQSRLTSTAGSTLTSVEQAVSWEMSAAF